MHNKTMHELRSLQRLRKKIEFLGLQQNNRSPTFTFFCHQEEGNGAEWALEGARWCFISTRSFELTVRSPSKPSHEHAKIFGCCFEGVA